MDALQNGGFSIVQYVLLWAAAIATAFWRYPSLTNGDGKWVTYAII